MLAQFVRHQARETRLHPGQWAIAIESIKHTDYAHTAEAQAIEQWRKFLTARKSCNAAMHRTAVGQDLP
jgi:hypothetical protein